MVIKVIDDSEQPSWIEIIKMGFEVWYLDNAVLRQIEWLRAVLMFDIADTFQYQIADISVLRRRSIQTFETSSMVTKLRSHCFLFLCFIYCSFQHVHCSLHPRIWGAWQCKRRTNWTISKGKSRGNQRSAAWARRVHCPRKRYLLCEHAVHVKLAVTHVKITALSDVFLYCNIYIWHIRFLGRVTPFHTVLFS